MFDPFSWSYTDVPSTSTYGLGGAEAFDMYFAPHDFGFVTFASGMGLFGHCDSSSINDQVGPSTSIQQASLELQLMSTQDVDESEHQAEHRKHGRLANALREVNNILTSPMYASDYEMSDEDI
ncbi:hypothetical protein GH714_041515 [Hevea brasiliensis]|uniref:Uncharacterized protein n=1 Tax=Hevea brasiliensis TaxID=3981 RepID=A0A6A6MSI7_HEVBR|nr:hypothetical protein GH714_041515 [Hevea brasiliensis]